jgi:hypothetical protein
MSSQPLEPNRKTEILNFDAEQRCKYLLKQVVANQEIWILTDEHGSVMVTTDEEDCIPVWPNQEFAQMWATNEWEGFKPKSIPLAQWHKKWTNGLEEDELSVVVFPLPDDEGAVFFPTELDEEIQQMANKVK